MKKYLLAALLVGASLAAHAQTYYLDLSGQTLHVPNRVAALEEVVDGRPGNPPIGIVYRGLAGKSAAVAFRNGLAYELTQFARVQLLPASDHHRVVLCLRSLHVGETVGGTREQATADLTADVYEHLGTGYHFVQRVSAYASNTGHETTGWHNQHVAELLSQCFVQLNQADWTAVAHQPARTLADLAADVPQPLATGGRRGPAILRAVPRRGLYQRFEQFLANQPDTLSPFVVDTIRQGYASSQVAAQWLGVPRVRPRAPARSGTSVAALWGFSDGHQAFVRYGKQYFPLMRQGSCFTFVGERPLDQVHSASLTQVRGQGIVLAGVAGAALAQTQVPDHSGEPMAYALDLRSGALEPYPGVHTPLRYDTAYVYVYRMPHTGPGAVSVVANGRLVGTLHAGQYLEVPWAHFGKPLRLCLNGVLGSAPCQCFVPNTAQLSYLQVLPTTTPRPWQWMPPHQGAADLDELDKPGKR